MSLIRPTLVALWTSFPRVSGDEPVGGAGSVGFSSFSPRERG